jgi:hypothetical protein
VGKMRISVTEEIYMERATYGKSLNRKEKKSKKRTMRESDMGVAFFGFFRQPSKRQDTI